MGTKMKITCVAMTIFVAICLTLLSRSAALCQPVQIHPDVYQALKHDLSPPLRDIKPAPREALCILPDNLFS